MLTCRVCGHKEEKTLVNHIETSHPELAEGETPALEGYILKYHVQLGDIVAQKKSNKIIIADVEFEKFAGGDYVPEINEAYHFPEFTKWVLMDIQEKKKIILTGHSGTGKSSLFEQLAARLNQNILRVNLNSQITVGDFVGTWTVRAGETIWIDGILPKAMREGCWLVLEEVDFAEPAILSILNTVLENNGKLTLKEKGHEVIVPHENFRIFATANTVGQMQSFRSLYQGTNIMNEAFLDRFRCYVVPYLPHKEEVKVVSATIPRVTPAIADVIVKTANLIRNAFEQEEISCTFSTRKVLDWSELMIRYKDPLLAANVAIFSKVSREDAEVIKGIIQRSMLKPPSAERA